MYSAPLSPAMATSSVAVSRSIAAKRAFDFCLTLMGLIATWPIFLLIALAVKASSPGPVFFVQKRVGLNGQSFGMIKFRSMYADAEARRAEVLGSSDREGICFKAKDDPRITPVGRVLRRLSLDELPQIFNVLRGDMSLVGPRPALPEEVQAYPSAAYERLTVLPGITGPWQISGRADLSFDQMVSLDVAYARTGNLATDLAILCHTANAVASGRGAY